MMFAYFFYVSVISFYSMAFISYFMKFYGCNKTGTMFGCLLPLLFVVDIVGLRLVSFILSFIFTLLISLPFYHAYLYLFR